MSTIKSKLIKLTSFKSGDAIYINTQSIGHIYQERESQYSNKAFTVVGTTCHNNGGFKVKEEPSIILEMMK
jgi:hypothetical protein